MDEDISRSGSLSQFIPTGDVYARQELAARKIQSHFRGYIYRYNMSMQDLQNFCARKIQNAWHDYMRKVKVKKCKEIIATKKISKTVGHYKFRKITKRKMEALREFEPILSFYPTKSKVPTPSKYTKSIAMKSGKDSSPVSRLSKRAASVMGRPITPKESKQENNQKLQKKSSPVKKSAVKSMPRPMMVGDDNTQKNVMRRKKLIELPPPWHNKDPRKLSPNLMDEMMYDQKGNLAWVKSDIMPLFMKSFVEDLDERDELSLKNERFKNRILQKIFLSPINRNTTLLRSKNPQDIAFIRDTGVYIFCTLQRVVMVDISTFSDDNVIYSDSYPANVALLDVIIDRHSGHTIGIDSHWNLHLFERGNSVFSIPLNPKNKIPVASKYLAFDHFGLLWVNLSKQKGPLLCFDPVTMNANTLVNFDTLLNIHHFINTLIYVYPLHFKDRPLGFAGLFSDTFDVYIFSLDFMKAKKLHNSDLNAFPNIRQVGQRLILWSEEKKIYVYDLIEQLDGIICTAKFTVPAKPIDVCGVSEPDLLFIALDDCTIRAYLSKGIEYPMRVPHQKLTFSEKSYANRLLGPATYTKSRNAYKELACGRLPNCPTHIDAFAITDKLSCVICAIPAGNCSSIWFMNDMQSVKAIDYDKFEYYEPNQSQIKAVGEYTNVIQNVMEKKDDLIGFIYTLCQFDHKSIGGQLSNLFNPSKPFYNLPQQMTHYPLRSLFSFIPEVPPNSFSAYDTFHFMSRSGILPDPLLTFAGFLKRFAPESEIINLEPPTAVVNSLLPVKTRGLYRSIVNITFTSEQISEMIELLDPLKSIRPQLSAFTLEGTIDVVNPKVKPSTKRKWLNKFERTCLQTKINTLTLLEDKCKHELMKRVSENIFISFRKNLLDKMQPVPSIDIHSKIPIKNGEVSFLTAKPIRNPLLDQNRHISIYENWSEFTFFGQERNDSLSLIALHIPRTIFDTPEVKEHFELIRHVSLASKYTQSKVFSVSNYDDYTVELIFTNDIKALPLSHYLTIHSYLGANSRSLLAARSIMVNVLTCLYQLHKNGVILRTLSPSNVLLNAQDGSIRIGTLCDCQTSSVYVPLPDSFAQPSNPFLPPEFYHCPMSEYTTAFDVWQFGMLLLYTITGFLPVSYGTELSKFVSKGDNGLYPECNFFYDWLKGCKIVKSDESCIGQRGECFFSTDSPGVPPSILQLDSYKLLPYKNTKLNYDESRLFIEIIASCLQIDPTKRPTIEDLFRTHPFNQIYQTGDILDNYMRNPNPNVFVSQFFAPVLGQLGDTTFPFAIGILSALLFHEDNSEEDMSYAFPLDSRAAERVIAELFGIKFIDRMVYCVLRKARKNIQLSNVIPNIKYKDPMFDALMGFFMRFVAEVENHQGSLSNHTNEIITSFFSLYAANPSLKRRSSHIISYHKEATRLALYDSSPLYIFTYSQCHALVRYIYECNPSLLHSITRTPEHDDTYFSQFLSFSEAVYNLANSMCYSIEKQRANAIKMMASLLTNGPELSTVRLFIDFRVPQKVLQCFHTHSARTAAASFIIQSLNVSKLKIFDPTYKILRFAVKSPIILLYSSFVLRSTSGNDVMKPSCFEIIKNIFMGEAEVNIESLIGADVIWSLLEQGRDPQCRNLMIESVSQAPCFFTQIIQASKSLQKNFLFNGIDFIPHIDYHVFEDNLDLKESLAVLKKMTGYFILKQAKLKIPVEVIEPVQIDDSINFFLKVLKMTFKEADGVAKFLDTQMMKTTRFEIKESNFVKSQNKIKETANNEMHVTILEVCKAFIDLTNSINFYYKKENIIRKDFYEAIKKQSISQIPICHTMPHLANAINRTLQTILLNAFKASYPRSQLAAAVHDFPEIWLNILRRDFAFLRFCYEKDLVEVQLMGKYMDDRHLRLKIFKALIINRHQIDIIPIFKFIITEMIHNTTSFKCNFSFEQKKELMFPIRMEAIDMLKFLISISDVLHRTVMQIVNVMIEYNFLEKERDLTDNNDNYFLVSSSIDLLTTLSYCENLFSEHFIEFAQVQLESLKSRYIRKWNDMAIVNEELERKLKERQLLQASKTPKGAFSKNGTPLGIRASTQMSRNLKSSSVVARFQSGRSSTSVRIYKP